MSDCAGCAQELLYPHQHSTQCPVFAHAGLRHEADFMICGCGYHCVNYADHFEHLRDVWRRQRQVLADR